MSTGTTSRGTTQTKGDPGTERVQTDTQSAPGEERNRTGETGLKVRVRSLRLFGHCPLVSAREARGRRRNFIVETE